VAAAKTAVGKKTRWSLNILNIRGAATSSLAGLIKHNPARFRLFCARND
jgi:hypothetical protein